MTTEIEPVEAPTAATLPPGSGVTNAHDAASAKPGTAAGTEPTAATRPRLAPEEFVTTWQGIVLRTSTLLRDPSASGFVSGIERVDAEIHALLESEPEASLLLLIQAVGNELQRYSVMHAITVSAICAFIARGLPDLDDPQRSSLRRAALTMNVAMTQLQDQLAQQTVPLTDDQRAEVATHASRGREALGAAGVSDENWLEAVARHHDAPPGALSTHPLPLRFARLIQRADVFVARMSPRKTRAALSAALAAKGAYFDENNKPDEAGSLIIKALGLYPVGSYVALANGETAIVLRRTEVMKAPLVATVVDARQMPSLAPQLRSTMAKESAITSGIQPKDVRVRVPIERLLKLMR